MQKKIYNTTFSLADRTSMTNFYLVKILKIRAPSSFKPHEEVHVMQVLSRRPPSLLFRKYMQ